MANNDVSIFVKHAACIAHISLLSFSLCLELREISQQPNCRVYWTFCRFSCSTCPGLCPACALPGSREHSRAAARLHCLEMQLELGGILSSTGGCTGSPWWSQRSFQPRRSWPSVLVHRDTLTWRRESRNSQWAGENWFQCENQKFLMSKWQ